MAITAGMSKCVGAACVRGVVMKELVLGRHQCVHTSVCTNFYGTRLSVRPWNSRAVSTRQGFNVRSMSATGENGAHKEPTDYDYDLVAIGAGSGGVRAARFAAQFGAKVAVCEMPFAPISSDEAGGVGGTCVLRGCVPKKLLVYAANFPHDFESSRGFGWSFEAEPKHDWKTLITNKNAELNRLIGVYKSLLQKSGVDLIEGRGKIADAHTVEVKGKKITAKHILISVGGRATVPNIPGKEHVITSDEALNLPERPNKICIVGGGYIALEFAGIFAGLGTEVHVFVRQPKVLRGFDEEIRDFIAAQLQAQGIVFHFGETPTAVEKNNDGTYSVVTDSGKEVSDLVMFATGRAPNTKDLGLEDAGVKLNKQGAIEVDSFSKTNVENIWAIGDVTNRINLTPVALMEGMAMAKTAFGNEPTKPDYRYIASAVFTQPPIATVGYTEEAAVEKFGDIDVYTSTFRPMKATLSGLPEKTFMKIIVDAASDKVVGMHMCGDETPEIMQGFAVAVKAGLTKKQFDSTVGIHPTAAEELVTMRTPTRKIRKKNEESGTEDKSQAPASAAY
ncbi:hypothetical protein M758_4G056700 [Ceratodon purpureus]|nr:hypothetical protein M758_4G056700 [Ceratodon purpureus]